VIFSFFQRHQCFGQVFRKYVLTQNTFFEIEPEEIEFKLYLNMTFRERANTMPSFNRGNYGQNQSILKTLNECGKNLTNY
jgi:hypothetical protein